MNHRPHFQQKTLQLALLLALSTGFAYPVLAADTAETSQAATRQYDIPAGDLATALQTLASESGVILTFTPAQTAGKQSHVLNGRYSIEQAFDILLTGSGLAAKKNQNNQYSLTKSSQLSPSSDTGAVKSAEALPEVKVSAKADEVSSSLQDEGKASAGYRVKPSPQSARWAACACKIRLML